MYRKKLSLAVSTYIGWDGDRGRIVDVGAGTDVAVDDLMNSNNKVQMCFLGLCPCVRLIPS